jgi:hypothetical protein
MLRIDPNIIDDITIIGVNILPIDNAHLIGKYLKTASSQRGANIHAKKNIP